VNMRSAPFGAQQDRKHRFIALLLAAAAGLAPCFASGASISETYHPIAGNQWTVDFTVVADGPPGTINGFTVYFPDTSFAALSLAASPATWDSIVVQPDTTLHSPGFLDSLALGTGIGSGASLGGFAVTFSFLGNGSPGPLHFDINDANFHAVYSGLTTVAAIPEPETASLFVLGLGAFAGRRAWQKRRQQTPSRSAA